MKKERLHRSEYVELAPEQPGQVHVNHEDCSAGLDTKKRLYIRRLEDGNTIVAYCHHCGKSGRATLSRVARRKRQADTSNSNGETSADNNDTHKGTETVRLPTDFDTGVSGWPAKARAWLYQFYLTDEDIKRGNIGWSDSLGRLVLPVFGPDGVAFYQTRRVLDEDTKPKYLTYGDVRSVPHRIDATGGRNSWVVLVEDTVSGLRVSHYHDTLVLHGTELSYAHIKCLLTNKYNHCMIYLDNDNPIVNDKALAMHKKLSRVIDDVVLITEVGDPKRKSNKELERVLRWL